jgi:predicted amidophosphoribosyltransferase
MLLASELEKLTGWAHYPGLSRVRATDSQVGKDAAQRKSNVAGAFKWMGGAAPSQVVLVDDVCTTGATLSECARVLRQVGVKRVCAAVVAFADVLPPQSRK